MATLYVTEPGTQVRKVGERLVLVKGQDVLDEIPLIQVEQVVMVGRGVSLTTAAMFTLTQKGVDIVYLSGAGRYVSRVTGSEHKHSRLRYAQALAVADKKTAQNLAGAVVFGKISNQRVLVRRHTERAAWAAGSLTGMDVMLKRIAQARDLDELRGLEGQAAKEYFALMRRLLARPRDSGDPRGWGFERRMYYPPTDPINAMLSFGYTLLLNDMVAACQMIGLDPFLGCFHAIDYGRPSMALDLIEEFRPVIVDSIVLGAVNHGMIGLRDFRDTVDEEGDVDTPTQDKHKAGPGGQKAIYLNAEGRRRFLKWYEERVTEQAQVINTGERTSYRRLFLLQAQQMARVLLGQSTAYQPFLIR